MLTKLIVMFKILKISASIIVIQILRQTLKTINRDVSFLLNKIFINKNPGKNKIKIRVKIDLMTRKIRFSDIIFVNKTIDITKKIVNKKVFCDNSIEDFMIFTYF